MCRSVTANIQKAKTGKEPDWIKELPWKCRHDPLPAPEDAEPAAPQWTFGWDSYRLKAYRTNTKTRGEETATSLALGTFEDPEQLVAKWGDDCSWHVTDLTASDLEAERERRKLSSTRSKAVFTGKHEVNHNEIVVKFRPDRDPDGLMYMYEQGAGILGVFCRLFPDKERAGKFLESIAKMYIAGAVMKEDLKQLRDDRLVELFGEQV